MSWFRRPDPVDGAWDRLERVLARDLPALRATLRAGATEAALDAAERAIGRPLPAAFRASWRRHDGQDLAAAPGLGLLFGLPFLTLDGVVAHWRASAGMLDGLAPAANLNRAAPDPTRRVRDLVVSPGWVPFSEDGSGAYVGLDLDPGPGGVAGQVINFGGREARKHVLAADMGRFLLRLAGEYERRNWRLEEVDGDAVLTLRDPPVDHVLDALPRWALAAPGGAS